MKEVAAADNLEVYLQAEQAKSAKLEEDVEQLRLEKEQLQTELDEEREQSGWAIRERNEVESELARAKM